MSLRLSSASFGFVPGRRAGFNYITNLEKTLIASFLTCSLGSSGQQSECLETCILQLQIKCFLLLLGKNGICLHLFDYKSSFDYSELVHFVL